MNHGRIPMIGAIPLGLSLASAPAWAQPVSAPIALAAVSPLAAGLLAVVLGLSMRSWRVATTHLILLCLWIVLFVLAAQNVENDYVVWTPLILYAVHVLTMLTLLGIQIAKRIVRWADLGQRR